MKGQFRDTNSQAKRETESKKVIPSQDLGLHLGFFINVFKECGCLHCLVLCIDVYADNP
jgi:hypothetical protein